MATGLISRVRVAILCRVNGGTGGDDAQRNGSATASSAADHRRARGAFIVPALAADRLVVNGYGAEFQEIITCTTIEPFEKKFGVKITYDDTGSGAGLSVYRAALEPDTSG